LVITWPNTDKENITKPTAITNSALAVMMMILLFFLDIFVRDILVLYEKTKELSSALVARSTHPAP